MITGVSNKNIQNKIVEYVDNKNLITYLCLWRLLCKGIFKPHNFTCLKLYSEVDAAKIRPFIAYKNLRNVKRSNPKDCELIWDETLNTVFIKKISAGTVWYCD